MARKKSSTLTDGELRLMDVLWDMGRGTVADVVKALPGERLAYNTVLTLMRILERKGYVQHEKQGRAFVYAPLVDRERARRSAVKHLMTRFFGGSSELLMLTILEQDDIEPEEAERLRRVIEAAE